MLIKTKDFGEIDIKESDIISFPKGVYAFDSVKEFVLLDSDAENGIIYMQAVGNENPRFILLDPYKYVEGYGPKISPADLKLLKARAPEELNIFVIAVVPEDLSKITVNLKSPVLINFNSKTGMQTILENSYPTRYYLFKEERTVG